MLRHVRTALPQVGLMLTGNAEANAAMLAINARLGYAAHKVLTTYQISIDALAAATGRRAPSPREGYAFDSICRSSDE